MTTSIYPATRPAAYEHNPAISRVPAFHNKFKAITRGKNTGEMRFVSQEIAIQCSFCRNVTRVPIANDNLEYKSIADDHSNLLKEMKRACRHINDKLKKSESQFVTLRDEHRKMNVRDALALLESFKGETYQDAINTLEKFAPKK